MAFRDRYSPAARAEKINTLAELGKMGFNLDKCGVTTQASKSDLLVARAELRRGMNALRDEAKKGIDSPNEARGEELMATLTGCANLIEDISNQLDMDEAADARYANPGSNSQSESVLRDRAGKRIGVLLSNADLRNESTIAKRIGGNTGNGIMDASDGNMTLGDFFRGVAGMRTSDGVKNALSEGTNSAGGYAVPTILLPGILNALVPASSLLTAGAHVGMLDNVQGSSFNIAATDTIPTAAWRSESGDVAESDPAFRSITITPRSLAFRFKMSRELLQDAPGIEQALKVAIAQAFAKELDRAGLRGSGTAPEIKGLFNIIGVNAINNGANGAKLTNYAKFINAARAIKEANAPAPTAAIMSPREDETIALFADTTGQPLRRPDALANWQFLTSSQIPTNLTVGTSTDGSEVYVGDFGQFTFFMREGVSVQKLDELYAATGEVGFVCHTRVDVAAAYAKAFAVITGVRG